MICLQGSKDPSQQDKRIKNLLMSLKKKQFLALFIEVASTCNLNCDFCHYQKNHKIFPKPRTLMSLLEYKYIINEIKQLSFTFKILNLHLHGESLLNKHFIHMVQLAKNSRIAKKINFSTNGTLLSPELFGQLVDSGIDEITVSLDTLSREEYKKFKGKDLLPKVLKNLNYIIKSISKNGPISLVIKCTVPSQDSVLDNKNVDQIIKTYGKYAENSKWVHIIKVPEFFMDFNRENQPCHQPCELPFYQVVIHVDGTVSCCCADFNYSLIIGRIGSKLKNTLKEILEGDRLRDIRKTILSGNLDAIPICKFCTARSNVDLKPYKSEILEIISRK